MAAKKKVSAARKYANGTTYKDSKGKTRTAPGRADRRARTAQNRQNCVRVVRRGAAGVRNRSNERTRRHYSWRRCIFSAPRD